MVHIQRVIVIGGGIGGLTMAAMLEKNGIAVTVYEQAPMLREVGAGVGLWSNAVRVLYHLELKSQLEACASHMDKSQLRDASGEILSQFSIKDLLAQLQIDVPAYVVHRADLLALLASRVSPSNVVTGKRCVGVETEGSQAVARFEDGSTDQADLIVGADGLWSVVRSSLFGDEPPRYSGEICWRGVASGSLEGAVSLTEISGAGMRFGIAPIDASRVYWFLTYLAPADHTLPVETRKAVLLEKYQGWPDGVEALLQATPADQMFCSPLYDRPALPAWQRGRVVLLGDAAHPTTPNMGQGACMAIEDAAVLTRRLLDHDTLPHALRTYETSRLERTAHIVDMSWSWGKVMQWSHPLAVWARKAMLKSTPDRVVVDQLATHMGYNPLEV